MKSIQRNDYLLLMSFCPCDVFEFFKVDEMHGLNLKDCQKHGNTELSSYIAGWANFIPKNGEYDYNDKRFIFINLKRCNDSIEAFGTIFHECMHHSLNRFKYDMSKEEQIITWAENEAHEIFKIINKIKTDK